MNNKTCECFIKDSGKENTCIASISWITPDAPYKEKYCLNDNFEFCAYFNANLLRSVSEIKSYSKTTMEVFA